MNEATMEKMLAAMTPELVAAFRLAIEIGKWPDGRRLSEAQRETCMQAMLAWELKNLPEHERTGYIDRGDKAEGEVCDTHEYAEHAEHDRAMEESLIKFRH